MRRTADVFHSQLILSVTPVLEVVRRPRGKATHQPGDVDGVWRGGRQGVELIVDYDECFERVNLYEVRAGHLAYNGRCVDEEDLVAWRGNDKGDMQAQAAAGEG